MADRYVPRKLVCIACGYTAGLLAATAGLPLRMLIPAAVCAAAVTVYGIKKHRAYITAAGIMILCAGLGLCAYPRMTVQTGHISFTGTVTQADTEGRPFYIIRTDDGTRIGIYTAEKDLIRGDRAEISGEGLAPKNESSMHSKGVYTVMYSPQIKVISHSRGIFRAAADIRKAATARIRSLEAGDSGEILIGMTFGSRYWDASAGAQTALYRSGAGHAAAVSGLHISVAAAFMAGIFRKNLRRRFAAVMAAGLFTALAADLSAPVIRALIMLAAVYAAPLFGRRSDPLTSLSAAVLAILIHAPYCVTGASFLLSVSGVMGAAVIAPAAAKNIRSRFKDEQDMPAAVEAVIGVLCTQAMILPVSLIFFDEISIAAPVTNISVLPLCTAAVFVSYAGVLAGMVFPSLSSVLFVFGAMICKAVLTLCSILSGIGTPLPAALMTKALIPAAAVSAAGFAAGKKAGTAVTVSAVSLMMIYASVVHAVPDTQTRVFTDEGCAVIAFTDGGAAVDLSGSSYTVRSLAARNGVYPTAVFCKDSMADEYKDIFPGAKIYDCDIYADYTVNGIPLHIDSGGAVIDTGETTVIHR